MSQHSFRSARWIAALALALTIPACGDDDGAPVDPPGDGGMISTGPVYAITTQIFDAMGSTSYIVLTDSVTRRGTLSLSDAYEVPGRAVAQGTRDGALFVGGSENPSITRYDLSPDGRSLVRGDSVSFAGAGVTSIGEYQDQIQIVSDTKAYYFDGATAQAVVWNPSEMAVDGRIDLSELVEAGSVLTFSTNAIRRGDDIYFPLGWRSNSEARVAPIAGVLVIHTSDDSYSVLRDDRGGYVRTAVEGPDGRLYLATEAYGTAVHRVNPDANPAPCLLRLNEDWTAFDGDFYVELADLFDGSHAGSLLPGADTSSAWIRVLDEDAGPPIGATTHPRILASSPYWSWWRIELGDEPTVERTSYGLSNGSDFLLNVDDAAVIPEFASDRSGTSLRDMSGGVPGDATLEIPGLTFSIVRLR